MNSTLGWMNFFIARESKRNCKHWLFYDRVAETLMHKMLQKVAFCCDFLGFKRMGIFSSISFHFPLFTLWWQIKQFKTFQGQKTVPNNWCYSSKCKSCYMQQFYACHSILFKLDWCIGKSIIVNWKDVGSIPELCQIDNHVDPLQDL